MVKQQCASNPELYCTCGNTGVCNNFNKKFSPDIYEGLSGEVLIKLRTIVELQYKKEGTDNRKSELEFLNNLITEKQNDNQENI